jgi:DNA-binding response OmpR family regulator
VYILVVEDDQFTSAMVQFALSKEGYKVETADNPHGAMHMILKQEPDLLILDINMPYQNGFEFSKKLRIAGYETPIIFMTAKDSVEDRLQGFNAGADDYICKPFNFQELVARAQAVMRRTKKTTNTGNQTIRCGGFELLTGDLKVVTPSGATVTLTPKEMRVLRMLMISAGQVVKRDRIFAEVWEDDENGSNSVDVYIRRLRVKLEEDPEHPQHILSVRGSGYKFIGRA